MAMSGYGHGPGQNNEATPALITNPDDTRLKNSNQNNRRLLQLQGSHPGGTPNP